MKRNTSPKRRKRRNAILNGVLLPDEWGTPVARRAAKQQVRANELLRAIRDCGPLSRAEAARLLGFNTRTLSLTLEALEREGLIRRCEQPELNRRGRRPVPYAFNPRAGCVVGLDIGRSVTVGIVMDLAGTVIVKSEEASDVPRLPEQQIHWLGMLVDRLLAKVTPRLPVAGIGLSPEGILHARHAGTRFSEEAAWLARSLESLTGSPVFVEDDSKLVALGERWFGHLSDRAASIAVLNVTDGLGVGLIIGDALYQGATRFAGELGHIPMGEPDIPCYCGGRSCLENTASGHGIERMAVKAGLPRKKTPYTAAEVAQLADSSPAARDIMDRFARGLARGSAVLLDLLNPAALVISGRLARFAPVFMDTFRAELARIAPPHSSQRQPPSLLENCTRMLFPTAHAPVYCIKSLGQHSCPCGRHCR